MSGPAPTRTELRDGAHAYDDLIPELAAHAAAGPDDPGSRDRRDRLVRAFLPLVHNLARRYSVQDNAEDVEQVGTLALIKAIDRYDPERASRGPLAYLVPCVRGEMKRHLRDHSWTAAVPREVKELAVTVNRAATELLHESGRSPRVSELAARLDAPGDAVVDALAALQTCRVASVQAPGRCAATPALESTGVEDTDLDVAEIRGDLRRAVAALPERERTVLLMRFWGNRTQSQIGEHIGVSQMHVSRLLTRSLARLREQLREHGSAPRTPPIPGPRPPSDRAPVPAGRHEPGIV